MKVLLMYMLPVMLLGLSPFKAKHEFVTLDFVFSSAEERQASLGNGSFVPEHCIPTAARTWNNTVLLAVPRLMSGVPFTLTSVEGFGNESVLRPYPNALLNWLGNPAGLRSVHSLEIDGLNRMWVLDAGRYNTQDKTMAVDAPAQLVLLDLNTSSVLHTFVFPDSVVSFSQSLLQDLALDQIRETAYISDRGLQGGILVYEFATNTAWRLVDNSMHVVPGNLIRILGVPYPSIQWAATGLALSADAHQLYYAPVNGNGLFWLECADLLRALPRGQMQHDVVNISQLVHTVPGNASQKSRLMGSSRGHIYFGLLSQTAVGRWSSASSYEVIADDPELLQWVDSVFFSSDGAMYVVSNKMHLFWSGSMEWTGANFRILWAQVNEFSYLTSQTVPEQPASSALGHGLMEDIFLATASGVIGLVIGYLITSCMIRSGRQPKPVTANQDTGFSVSEGKREFLLGKSIREPGVHASLNPTGPSQVPNQGANHGWLFSD